MTNLTEFWRGRLATHGHTGWADQKIYEFDQPCRLQRLAEYLDGTGLKPGRALDFGCGSGDFSRLLIRRGWTVVAYDRYVSPRLSHPRMISTQSFSQVAQEGLYDLIISITVLDCIVDDAEFSDRLKEMGNLLAPNGRFFFLEYAVDVEKQRSTYQGFRRFSEWRAHLAEAGLVISAAVPYFHPQEATIPAWEHYRRMFLVRALGRLGRLGLPLAAYAWLLRMLRNRCLASHPYVPPSASPIKIMTGHTLGSSRPQA
jgi:SAM-dependent methyltransferase